MTMAAATAMMMLSSFLPSVFVLSFSNGPTSSRNVIRSWKNSLQMSATPFNYGQQQVARQNIRLPLLVDIVDQEDGEPRRYDVPLANAHLPPELTTASLYKLNLDVPLHRSVIQDAISSGKMSVAEEGCCYGHVVYTPDNSDDLVGAIGCAAEILIGAPTSNAEEAGLMRDNGEDSGQPLFVLARGGFRFRVKEIIKSIPYNIALVDELIDDQPASDESNASDEGDLDIYDTMAAKDLIKEIFQALGKILKAQEEAASTPLSPLEKSILEGSNSGVDVAMQKRFDAEERVAVFETFVSSLLDIAPGERDRLFAVAMMAGELANLPSDVRMKMLVTTDGVARLRIVLRVLASMLSLDSARKITKSLSLGGGGSGNDINIDTKSLQEAEDSQKDLKVGIPKLPPWASQIQKGVRVEYYWNDEEGWCLGTVDEDPVKILEEVVISVKFDDDGSIHRIPLTGEQKARWRPPMGNTGAFD